MIKKFFAVFHARNLEFLRDGSSLGWNIAFPVLVVFGFAVMFSGGSREAYKVALLNGENASLEFLRTQYVKFVPIQEVEEGIKKVQRHQVDMLFDAKSPQRYWINSSSPKGYFLERILRGSGLPNAKRESVRGEEVRYVDWLIAGLLGMNIMFSALFGVGYTIVRYRKNGVLKRLKATPLTAFEFICAHVLSRLVVVIIVNVLVYIGCNFFIHFHMLGSYLDLFVVMVLGTFCLITLGLVVASRISSEEFAGGLLNLLCWPMMFLSGVWFSLEGMNPFVIKAAQLLPLTHMIDGARAIMTNGAGLADISTHLLVLVAMSAIFLFTGSRMFRWE